MCLLSVDDAVTAHASRESLRGDVGQLHGMHACNHRQVRPVWMLQTVRSCVLISVTAPFFMSFVICNCQGSLAVMNAIPLVNLNSGVFPTMLVSTSVGQLHITLLYSSGGTAAHLMQQLSTALLASLQAMML